MHILNPEEFKNFELIAEKTSIFISGVKNGESFIFTTESKSCLYF